MKQNNFSQKMLTILFMVGMLLLAACSNNGSEQSNKKATTTSKQKSDLDFSHFFPPNHEQETVVVQEFISRVADATDGKLKVTSYPGASLAAPSAQFDSAATGAVDIGLSVHSYTPNQFPLTSVMELPFISESGVQGSKVLWQLYEEFPEMQKEYAEVIPLWLYTTEPGQLFTVGKQVKSVEDLKGMRIRSPSPEVNEWLTALGASPVSMSMNETYEALEKGVVDGTVGPWHTLLDYSLHSVVDYVTVGNFYMSTFFTVMNTDSYDALGVENQKVLKDIGGEKMGEVAGGNFDKRAEEAIKTAKESGIEIYQLSDQDMEEWKILIHPTIEKWIIKMEDKGLPGQKIYDRAVELSQK